MANRNLYKEAIAEAKTIKEMAIAQAKAALEESFTPHLQSMLSKKLEEMEEEDMLDEEETIEEINSVDEAEDMDEELSLEELLEELESETELNESEEESEDEESDDEESEEEFDLENMTEDELIKFIESVIEEMLQAGEIESEEENEETEVEDEEIDLEIEDDEEDLSENNKLDELFGFGRKKSKSQPSQTQKDEDECPSGQMKWRDGRCYPTTYDDHGSTKSIPRLENGYIVLANPYWSMEESYKAELEEAQQTIETLRNSLQETKLLNSKLLYVNKIFKSNELNEAKKLKIVESFDKAQTVREAKLMFESINESLKETQPVRNKKRAIRENKSIASSIISNNTKKSIIDVDPQVARWQKLAGIK